MLVGALSHSGRFRAVFCEQMTFGYLVGALHEVLGALGGTPRVWRVDRMATAVVPGTDRLNPQFAQLAKHYGVEVAICPPHRPQRKGVVEAAVKFIGGRWWRTVQVGLDGEPPSGIWMRGPFASLTPGGAVIRRSASLAAPSRCGHLPALRFPAEIVVERQASRSALVAFEGNRYSVPPAHAGRTARRPCQRRRAAPADHLDAPACWSRDTAAPAPGPGRRSAPASMPPRWRQAVLEAFTTQPACRTQDQPAARRRRARRARALARPRTRYAGAGRLAGGATPSSPRPADEHRHPLPATARASHLPQADRRRRSSSHPRSKQPSARSPATPGSCTTCSPPRSPRASNAASKDDCGSPSSQPTRHSNSSTTTPSPHSTGAWSKTSPRCASSKRKPTPC